MAKAAGDRPDSAVELVDRAAELLAPVSSSLPPRRIDAFDREAIAAEPSTADDVTPPPAPAPSEPPPPRRRPGPSR